MRDIRFRAWDKNTKSFFYAELLSDRYKVEQPHTEHQWEQYTGLKDMHNGELFDGQLGEGTVGDKGYKGIKNRLRDCYKAETGIDPAPNYPINAKLKLN